MSIDYLFYNEDLKEQFIEINSYAKPYFKIVFESEKEKDKDISQFTTEEILAMYKSLCSGSQGYLMNINRALDKYASFCLSKVQVPDGQNHFAEISPDIMKECLYKQAIENKIISSEALRKQEDLFINRSDACLIRAAFEGICGKHYRELANLHLNQLHGNTLKLESRELEVSTYLVGLMEEATKEEKYIYEDGKRKELKYSEGDTRVFKDFWTTKDNDDRREVRIFRKMLKIQSLMDKSKLYSFNGLRISGRIHQIKQFMTADKCTAKEAIYNHRDEIENRYSHIPSIKEFLSVYGEYLVTE